MISIKRLMLLVCTAFSVTMTAQFVNIEKLETVYTGDLEQLMTHESPKWFNDAKLGIFIHWGLYSVPAYATTDLSIEKLISEMDSEKPDPKVLAEESLKWFTNNGYAEWYLNSLRIQGSPTYEHHKKTYGLDYDYYKFSETFSEETLKWDSDEMAEIFKNAGAKYVVLTTKHHDGYTLWPSRVQNNNMSEVAVPVKRDIVGDLTKSVRAKGMRMGLYYSGGLDWTFNRTPIYNLDGFTTTLPNSYEYAGIADAHWRELIEKYKPSVLWNDITYPLEGNLEGIIADYYNLIPDGVINNRWGKKDGLSDFDTPEYNKMEAIQKKKWESCRGLGYSFGYNQYEGDETTLSSTELIHLFVDIVSKNGNLLLNVGPKPDGSIPEIQLSRLRDLGDWMSVNGEGIYGTSPWERPETTTESGKEVRFTQKEGALYVFIFGSPDKKESIQDLTLSKGQKIDILGGSGNLKWNAKGTSTEIRFPKNGRTKYATVLKISS